MPHAKKMKILFVTSEVVPFIKTGGLADVSSALPQKLQEMGHDVRIIVPKYGSVDEKKYRIHEVVRLKDITTEIGDKKVTFSLRSSFLVGSKARVQIYFLDNEEYFNSRPSLYTDPSTGDDYADNDERFILLNKAVFHLVDKLGWIPDIIHCNDWHAGLVPVYLRKRYNDKKVFENVKTVFTIHNLAFQGNFDREVIKKAGLENKVEDESSIITENQFSFLKAAVNYADKITTVSERYAEEICSDPELSGGLQETLCSRREDITGIINGIDGSIWNPEKDKLIAKKYSIKNLETKEENKKALVDKFGLSYKENTPVISMVSRLLEVKGFDLLMEGFDKLMELDIQFILLGAGEKKYHRFFEDAIFNYNDKFSCYLGFDDQLAHLIEAGSDIFLMPSKYEPCGLNQMYSLIYGTPPVVRETGGLADTVIDVDSSGNSGNGFKFSDYSVESMIVAIKKAVDLYQNDPKTWQKIMKNGMRSDFSWINSSRKYHDIYRELVG